MPTNSQSKTKQASIAPEHKANTFRFFVCLIRSPTVLYLLFIVRKCLTQKHITHHSAKQTAFNFEFPFAKQQNFRLVQIQRVCRRHVNSRSNSDICLLYDRKHIWKKKKPLLSTFPPFPAVFQKCTSLGSFNPLPDDTILDWSKLKQTADDSLKYI